MVGAEADRRRKTARSATSASAHDVRHGDAERDGFLPRGRELFAPSDRQETRRAAADTARLPAARYAGGDRRIAPDNSASARHVLWRSVTQEDSGGIRISPAFGARQPA